MALPSLLLVSHRGYLACCAGVVASKGAVEDAIGSFFRNPGSRTGTHGMSALRLGVILVSCAGLVLICLAGLDHNEWGRTCILA